MMKFIRLANSPDGNDNVGLSLTGATFGRDVPTYGFTLLSPNAFASYLPKPSDYLYITDGKNGMLFTNIKKISDGELALMKLVEGDGIQNNALVSTSSGPYTGRFVNDGNEVSRLISFGE